MNEKCIDLQKMIVQSLEDIKEAERESFDLSAISATSPVSADILSGGAWAHQAS